MAATGPGQAQFHAAVAEARTVPGAEDEGSHEGGKGVSPVQVRRLRSGAYVADAFTGGVLDRAEWQLWRLDPAVTVEPTAGGLLISGTTSVDKRAFSGLVSRRLYPADAVLACEVRVPSDLSQPGTYGFVVHLCNRLVGDEVRTLEIPDNNSEIAFGRMGEAVGWFHWWYNQTGGTFYKWQAEEPARPAFGDEAERWHTVAVEYDEPTRTSRAWLWTESGWEQVGRDRQFRKLCSSIELKIDAQRTGLTLAFLLRNCRLYPHPARTPVTVYVGGQSAPARAAGVSLLSSEGKVLAQAEADADGIAHLLLPADACYPLSGRFRVGRKGKVSESDVLEAPGVEGVYPGDFYAVEAGEEAARS